MGHDLDAVDRGAEVDGASRPSRGVRAGSEREGGIGQAAEAEVSSRIAQVNTGIFDVGDWVARVAAKFGRSTDGVGTAAARSAAYHIDKHVITAGGELRADAGDGDRHAISAVVAVQVSGQ